MTWEQVLGSLAGSGPLGLVLGYAVMVLWKEVKALRQELADKNREQDAFLKSLLTSQSEQSGNN